MKDEPRVRWEVEHLIRAARLEDDNCFGRVVALQGNLLLVGGPDDSSRIGAHHGRVFVYDLAQQRIVPAPEPE